ncbi:MAG: 2-nitropropane dioxygenase [Acidimicrobiales bacterium]|nr:MAG: 2-nitropropane dioxygenase [Acidimicrobiales bacterium]
MHERLDSSAGPAPDRRLRTPICDLLGIELPIVQTGMGWVSGARLTAATSDAGGLGILASGTMSFPELETAINEVRERTDRPFGVNIRSNHEDVERVVRLLIREGVAVASFAHSPNERLIKSLRDGGVRTMPTVAARRHAEKVAAWGVDAVIAQGHEGGGHTGAISTSLLVPEIVDTIDVPVLAAGGFRDGRGLVAALAWGAAGIAMGTRFLLTQESTVPDLVKQEYLAAASVDTVVTKAVDGLPQRVIRTPLVDRLERSRGPVRLARAIGNVVRLHHLTTASYRALAKEGVALRRGQSLTMAQLAMAANAPLLTRSALVDGHLESGILPTGQVAGVIDDIPTVRELLGRLHGEALAAIDRLDSATRPA